MATSSDLHAGALETASVSRSARFARSLLFAPANQPRKVERALKENADAIILDLEDSVPPGEKAAAREEACRRLDLRCASPRQLFVRVNAVDTVEGFADLLAVIRPGLDGVVIPKLDLETGAFVSATLGLLEAQAGLAPKALQLLGIVETAKGLSRLERLPAAAPRLTRLAFGAADLAFDLDLEPSDDERELLPLRLAIVVASRTHRFQPPVDTAALEYRDLEVMRREATRARRLGMGGKFCIHPDQIGPVHGAFTPSAAAVKDARRRLDVFEDAVRRGSAAASLDGKLVDTPVAQRAYRILAQAACAEAMP